MTMQEKRELVGSFERAYEGIAGLLADLPDEVLHFVPPIPDAWSTNDHLVHILDADMSICFRLRICIAQPGFAIPVWNDYWVRHPQHERLGLSDLLVMYRDHAKKHEGFIKRNREDWTEWVARQGRRAS